MDFKGILKNKYFLYGSGIVLLIVLYSMLKGGGGSASGGTTTTVASGPSDAQIQASTAITLAQIDAATKASAASSSIALQRDQIQLDLTKTGIQADLAKYSLQNDYAAQMAQINADSKASENANATATAQTKYLADLSASVTKYQLDNQAMMQVANNSFQLDYAEQANHSAEMMASFQASIASQQITASRDITLGGFASQTAQIQAMLDNQLGLAQISADTSVTQAKIAAAAQKKKKGGFFGFLGDVVKTVAPLVL